MEQNPLCIAFASQKGGVGKSTLTVLAASWSHYLHGIRVAVVDCDYPQRLHPQTLEPRQGRRAIFGDLRQTPRFARREQRGEALSYSLLQTFRGNGGMAEMGRRRRRTIRCRAVRPSGNGGQ
ncbi:MAG: ParA family protein [Alistipes shahii]|uniref:ParA family protein n=1 Tax=Alistipes shahii TaxID=328814 RepID=UPI00399D0182